MNSWGERFSPVRAFIRYCRGLGVETNQDECHTPLMENVNLTQKEQARLQVLNRLLAEHMTLD